MAIIGRDRKNTEHLSEGSRPLGRRLTSEFHYYEEQCYREIR
jgi:hypothetical protein